jgi:uncharacterized delta-60 repeat protein
MLAPLASRRRLATLFAVTVGAGAVVFAPTAAQAVPLEMVDTTYGVDGIGAVTDEALYTFGRIDNEGRALLNAYGVPSLSAQTRRVTPDGEIDPSYTPVPLANPGQAVLEESSRVVTVAATPGTGVALTRYAEDGTLDTGFGTGGTAAVPVQGMQTLIGTVVRDSGYVVVGERQLPGEQPSTFLAAVTFAGQPDSSWGVGGLVEHDVVEVHGVATDGDAVVVDYTDVPDRVLIRFASDGEPDAAFGDGGAVEVPADAAAVVGAVTRSLVVADGGYYIFGRVGTGDDSFLAVTRFTDTGVLDTAHGVDGTAAGPAPDCGDVWPHELVVVAGVSYLSGHIFCDPSSATFYLNRITADGEPDETFADAGVLFFDEFGDRTLSSASLLGVDFGGRLLVAVESVEQSGSDVLSGVLALRTEVTAGAFVSLPPSRILDTARATVPRSARSPGSTRSSWRSGVVAACPSPPQPWCST